jgi:cell division protease FtsH
MRLRTKALTTAMVVTFAGATPMFAAASESGAISSYTGLVRAIDAHSIRSATLEDDAHLAIVAYRDGRTTTVRYPASDTTLAQRMVRDGVDVRVSTASSGLPPFLPPLLFVMVLLVISLVVAAIARTRRRDRSREAPAQAHDRSIGAIEAAVAPSAIPLTRFADVAGCDEAVEELAEIVAFLQTPEKFSRLDAHMPAGLLLTGPPGTGKTMLARALAGEAGVRFFAASASEFVEKYVGVGASRVRELFKRASANAPSVIFLDELDAIGASRGGIDGNSEREQTLNELLVRMDGFSPSDHVIVVAATNRPEVLDPALLRPGRFSRQITIGLPSAEGRRAILGVHSNSKPLASDVDLDALAATAGGFSGAQLAELLNEAAIMAAREDRDLIETGDLLEGLRRVVAGPKRKSAPIAEGELEKIAYHEAGHVVCAELCEHHENAQHVTIDPRGNAMGFALFGQEDRALYDEEHFQDAMTAALGGRAAEELVYGRVSSGAKNDLEKVNAIARAAVTEYGMSAGLGQFGGDERQLSNQTKARIDREVERFVAAAYARALALLDAHRRQLDKLAKRLLEARELERVDIVSVLA